MNILTDGEVTVRPFRPDDKYRMAELANNEKIWINLRDKFPYPYSLADAESFIEMALAMDPQQMFAIEFDGLYVGNIGLHKRDDVYRLSAEIGYFLGEPYWNKGIMTRAVNLLCEYGFNKLDIIRIDTGVFEYNLASQKVLEKCGFVREAVFVNSVIKNERICNEVRFAKIKGE